MKKILTGILALALAVSMAVPSFAANNDGTKGTDITVNGTYQAAEAPTDVISADIAWDNMDFTYTAGSKGTWNASAHQYDNPTEGGWAATSGTDPKITVTNHSNVSVDASFDFATAVDGLNGSFTKDGIALENNTLTLAPAEGTEVAAAPTGTVNFDITGVAITQGGKLGTITVYIDKSETVFVSTADELNSAFENGGTAVLTCDLEIADVANPKGDVSLDLAGHKLTLTGYSSIAPTSYSGKFTLSNGTVVQTNRDIPAIKANDTFTNEAVIKNCTIIGEKNYAISINGGRTVLEDCTIETKLAAEDGTLGSVIWINKNGESTLTMRGNMTVIGEDLNTYDWWTDHLICEVGTYNFDPTLYVNGEAYDITTDGSTWTVAAK